MAFTIEFDYRFDTNGYFDDPALRAVLEDAAAAWEAVIADEFEDIPAGASFSVNDPDTGQDRFVTLDAPIDDVLIFIGVSDTPFGRSGVGVGARGGPAGFDLAGDIYRKRIDPEFRDLGPTLDFEPWAGNVTFQTQRLESAIAAGSSGDYDGLRATTIHELGHVFGIGTSGAFAAQSSDGVFLGPNALAVAGQGVRLEDDEDHFDQASLDAAGVASFMGPIAVLTTATEIPPFDIAVIADLGFEIAPAAGTFTTIEQPFDLATNGPETIFGSEFDDWIDALGGDDQIAAAGGNDTLIGGPGDDTLFGQDGTDRFLYAAGADFGTDQIGGFEAAGEIIMLEAGLGFATGAAVVSALSVGQSTSGSAFSRLITPNGTIEVFSDTPLTAANFEIVTTLPEPPEMGEDPGGGGGGGGQELVVRGTPDDDVIVVAEIQGVSEARSVIIEGDAGRDVVEVNVARGAIAQSVVTNSVSVAGAGPELFLLNVEVLRLLDGAFLYDLSTISTLDEAYRLYAAGFARTPDEGGLRFWTDELFAGRVTLKGAAEAFVESEEFALRYGAAPTDEDYVIALYDNVLQREPDDGGFTFWVSEFSSGRQDRADMLVAFSESEENINQTAGDLSPAVWVI
ncbi:MAG: DUF4214 domain-containing protein [Pseudomonadota bacterium]